MRENYRHLYADTFWFGVLGGSAMAFIAIFAARLGASSFQISLLTAGPGVINLLFSLPAGRWLEGRPLVRTSFCSAVLYRLGYLAFVPLPWLLGEQHQVWAIVWITLLASIPGTLLAISFNALFADVVPAEMRGEVVGKRNALMAISLTGTTLICGALLDRIAFPTNYQIVFGLGAFGAALSTYHLGRLYLPGLETPRRNGQPIGDLARPGLMRFLDTLRHPAGLRFLTRSGGKPLLRLDLLRGPFGPFMAAYLIFYACQYVPLPLFPLAFVHQMKLTDGQISLGSALFYLTMMLVSLRLGYASVRFGHRRMLVFGAIFYSLYPLILGLARDASLYWVASLIGGGVWAVTSASLVNRLMERVPEDERPAYMALHNLALNLGILLGSLAGPALSEGIGLRQAILLGAGLRLLAGILLGIWG
ncbi:MAG: MFS transporter [Chloroflexota bacterium]